MAAVAVSAQRRIAPADGGAEHGLRRWCWRLLPCVVASGELFRAGVGRALLSPRASANGSSRKRTSSRALKRRSSESHYRRPQHTCPAFWQRTMVY